MSHAIYRAAELIVRAWVKLYLVGVPREARGQRRAEIASDLYEYRLNVQEQGISPAAAGLYLLLRCTAGALDDLLWRSELGGALGGLSMLYRSAARAALATAFILLLPFLAMQLHLGVPDPGGVTEQVAWTPFDFAFAGVLLFGAGLTYQLIAKKMGSVAYQAAVGVAVAAALLLVWVNGAVGIIGSEDNSANLMYGGVLAVGIIGTLIARFRPHGMARVLFATAFVQALVAVIALIATQTDPSFWGEAIRTQQPSPVLQLLGVNGMFIALFLGSAWLFRTAARGGGLPLVQGRRVDPRAG